MKVLLLADIGTNKDGFYHIGDEAMFHETERWYKTYQTDIEIGSLSRSGVNLPFPFERYPAILYCAKLVIKSLILKIFKLSLFSKEQRIFIDFISRYEVLHFTGGGNIYSTCPSWLYYCYFLIFFFKLNGKKIIMTSQTIGPLEGVDKLLGRYFLNLPSLIVLREDVDEGSRPLGEYGIAKPKIAGMLDAAYNLPVSDVYKLPKKRCLRIGLSIHQLEDDEHEVAEMVRDTIIDLARTYKLEIVVIPHIIVKDSVKIWGRWYMKNIINHLPSGIKIIMPKYSEIVVTRKCPESLIKSMTAQCDLMIVTRYHGLIFSLSTNTPVVAIAKGQYYLHKDREALRFLYGEDIDNYLVNMGDNDPLFELKEKVLVLVKNLESEKLKMHELNNKLYKRTDLFNLDRLDKSRDCSHKL